MMNRGTGTKAPQTGDTAAPGIWIALMGLSVVLGVGSVL